MRALEHFSNTAWSAFGKQNVRPFSRTQGTHHFSISSEIHLRDTFKLPGPVRSAIRTRVLAQKALSTRTAWRQNRGDQSFRERTRKATSVDSPIFAYSLLFKSNVNVESLHKDAHMDKCNTDGKSAGCFTTSLLMELKRCCLGEITPLDASRINPFGAYELPSTSNSLNKGADYFHSRHYHPYYQRYCSFASCDPPRTFLHAHRVRRQSPRLVRTHHRRAP